MIGYGCPGPLAWPAHFPMGEIPSGHDNLFGGYSLLDPRAPATWAAAQRQQATEAAEKRDRELVAAVLRKDRKATAELVERHADAVYGYARRRLMPREDLVEDLVQEVFLAVWARLAEFRGEGRLEAWILGIARHKVEDYYRGRLREPDPLGEEADTPAASVDVPPLDELLDQQRLLERAHRVLESLPEAYRLALLWRYWEKRSAREMAAATGKSEKAMERLLARARTQFRRSWDAAEASKSE
jgi:RNA polymerase sigma-70 factor (ECF subfamily)